jgi:hypothetical protein
MTPDRESRLEAALAALLAEVNMREDYPPKRGALATRLSPMLNLRWSYLSRWRIEPQSWGRSSLVTVTAIQSALVALMVAMPMADAFAWMIGRALRQHIYLVIQTASFVTSRPSMSTLGSA